MTSGENLPGGRAESGNGPGSVAIGAGDFDVRAEPVSGRDRPARWLTVSMVSLGVLAAASAVVSLHNERQPPPAVPGEEALGHGARIVLCRRSRSAAEELCSKAKTGALPSAVRASRRSAK